MAVKVLMPKLGLTMTEGKIVRWLKKEGDLVKKGEALLEVMTEKITTEVESPEGGILVKIIYDAGKVIPISEPIALIAGEDEDWSAAVAELEVAASAASSKEGDKPGEVEPTEKVVAEETKAPSARIKISPVARRIAADKGLSDDELQNISGSGPSGRIVKEDIYNYLEQKSKQPPPAAAAPAEGRTEPLSELRSVIARRMTQSFTTTPHFYLEAEADAGSLLAMRRSINETLKKDNESVSVNDILVKITAAVLRKHPYLNSSYSEQGIVFHDQVNIGVAVALERGLIVPVIKDAPGKGLREIASTGRSLIEKARSDSLSLDDITGGTFTLSNLGMFAVDSFTAIINPPESAILTVGRIMEKPVCSNGEIVVKQCMRLTIGLDHRVLDGAQGARFLDDLKACIENPHILIL